MEIGPLVEKTGPRHHHKQDFHLTNKNEHMRLFSEINQAVHYNPNAFASINYLDINSSTIDKMLTDAEITHLQDVANIIKKINMLGWIIHCFTFLMMCAVLHRPKCPPPILKILKKVGISTLCVTTIIYIIGPIDVFYQLHIWIFPEQHQWFFYYEESLMSLIMKAPYLFGYIGALLLTTALVTTTLIIFFLYRWIHHSLMTYERETIASS